MVNLSTVMEKGYVKLWGEHSLTLGEAIVFGIAIAIVFLKDKAILKNKWFLIALALIFIGMALF